MLSTADVVAGSTNGVQEPAAFPLEMRSVEKAVNAAKTLFPDLLNGSGVQHNVHVGGGGSGSGGDVDGSGGSGSGGGSMTHSLVEEDAEDGEEIEAEIEAEIDEAASLFAEAFEGLMTYAPDGKPVVGRHPLHPNLWFCTCTYVYGQDPTRDDVNFFLFCLNTRERTC